MEEDKNFSKTNKKRTQKDYTLGFKSGNLMLVEKGDITNKQSQKIFAIQGQSTVLVWLRKYGNLISVNRCI